MPPLHLVPEPSDGLPLSEPEPYWQAQLRLPSHHRDTRGMLGDLWRRLLTRMFHVRWRLIVEFLIEADINAPDEASASAALESALHGPGTVFTLSRANPGGRWRWLPIGLAQRPWAYIDYGVIPADPSGDTTTAWDGMARVVVAFTVDVAEACWPDDRYAVWLFADGQPPPRNLIVDPVHVSRRRPVRTRNAATERPTSPVRQPDPAAPN